VTITLPSPVDQYRRMQAALFELAPSISFETISTQLAVQYPYLERPSTVEQTLRCRAPKPKRPDKATMVADLA